MADNKKGGANARKLSAQLRAMSVDEIYMKLAELKEQLMHDRFRHATASLENTALLKAARRQIARMETILTQKKREAANDRA